MFICNKYYNWYNNIIESARSRNIVEYTEQHHIVPFSLGGKNTKDNLVRLTAKEHFICHLLLPKILSNSEHIQKMNYALWLMMNVQNENQTERYRINSTHYAILKEKLSKVFSKQHNGRKKSEETKRKMSETRKRKIASGEIVVNENKEKYKIIAEKRRGTTHSEETKRKIGNAHRGKTISEDQKQHLSKINTGKKMSAETKEKIRKSMIEQHASGNRKRQVI